MSTKKVLVIESDETFAQSLRSMFSKHDAELKVISDGKEGLEAAKEEPPDLILLCVELPNMSGYSICQKLKKDKELKAIPLVVMSSEATEDTFEQHKKLKTRADDYIIKPFSIEQLLPKISSLISIELKASDEEVELITLDDDDESISIEGDESLNFDESLAVGESEEDLLNNVGENESTRIAESPLLHEEDANLEKFDSAFDGLQVDEPNPSLASTRVAPSPQNMGDESIEELDDVLGSLKDLGETAPKEEPPKKDDDLDFSGLDDLGLSEGKAQPPPAASEAPIAKESQDEDDLGLGPDPSLDAELGLLAPANELQEEAKPAQEQGLEQTDSLGMGDPDLDAMLDIEAKPGKSEPISENKPIPPTPSVAPAKSPVSESDLTRPTMLDSPPPALTLQGNPALEARFSSLEEENRGLREKNKALITQMEEARKDFERRESEIGSIRNKTASKDKESLALRSTINAKERENLDLKEEINRKDQEILDTQEKLGVKDEEIGKLQDNLARREKEVRDLSARIETLVKEKNEQQEQHQALMADWEERYTRDTAELEHNMAVAREEHQEELRQAKEQVEASQEETTQIRAELDESKQRHGDEVFGLRTRYRNDMDKLQGEMNLVRQQLDQTKQRLEQELVAHEATRQEANKLPQVVGELERARGAIDTMEQQIADLKRDVAAHEDRVVRAYQKIKGDEKIKEKARKALDIALTLLTDQVSGDDRTEAAQAPDETPY
jgi:DNA-binding response OmpR family regulator